MSASSDPPPRGDPLDEEIQFHFDATIKDLVARGWTPEAARTEAARRFGDRGRWQSRIRAVDAAAARSRHGASWRPFPVRTWMTGLRRDVVHGWRSVRQSPGLAVLTLITLGFGLGGTATMFAAVNAAFLKPLPFPNEDGLVKIYEAGSTRTDIRVPLEVAQDWHRASRTLSATGAYLSGLTANVSGSEEAVRARVTRVTRPFFAALGVAPARGRLLGEAETTVGAAPAVVISHRLWQRTFNGRRDVLDQRLIIDGFPVAIVGVMPDRFSFPDDTDIWAAVEREGPGAYGSRTAHNFDVIARLSSGRSIDAAARELNALTDEQRRVFPEMAKATNRIVVSPLRADLLGAHAQMVWIGLGAVVAVLLVACVNVANLMLTRSLSRDGETSIRVALGAGRAAIVRSVLVEGLLLASGGAAVGVVLAHWGVGWIGALAPASVTGGAPLRLDGQVIALTAIATAVSGLLCAVLPAIRSSRVDPRQALAASSRGVATSPRRLMHALVGIEVALAFVLLFSALLLTESHARLSEVDSGFRQHGLTLARFSLGLLPGSPYGTPEARRTFFERMERAVAETPGVRRVGLAAIMPPGFSPNGRFVIEGRAEASSAHFRLVGGDYFGAMGIPLRRGRVFTADDRAGRPEVAVVNETLARVVFGGVDPIGQVISMPGMDGGPGVATIVGIVGDVRHRGPSLPPVPEAYFSYQQRPWRTWGMTLIVDSSLGAEAMGDLVRARAKIIDPLVPPELSAIDAAMAPFVEPSAFRARLLRGAAVVALLLALVGIGGVVSHGAAKRQRELGIRAALGARPASLSRLVIGTGMRPVLIGALCGSVIAFAVAEVLRAFVFDVSVRDARSLVVATAAMLAAGVVASWWPARRMARVDPAAVLRS